LKEQDMKMQFKLAALSLAMALSNGAQAEVVVDLFEGNQGFNVGNGTVDPNYVDGTATATDTDPIITNPDGTIGGTYTSLGGDILGDEREIWVSKISGGGTVAAYTNVNGFNFDNASLTQGRAQIQWDGTDDSTMAIDYEGLGGTDLTMGGVLGSFEVTTVYSDGGYFFEITAYTDATNWTKLTLTGQQHLSSFTNYIDFLAFSLADNTAFCDEQTVTGVGCYPDGQGGFVRVDQNGTGVNLANLGALVLDINRFGNSTINSLDITLRSIKAVPEPGILGLLGLGLLGFAVASRRNRKQA
jgi:hypothetical protein